MESVTYDILHIFEGYRMAPLKEGDLFEEKGRAALAAKIDTFVRAYRPVRFSMLGYPAKSPNDRDKVLGKLPDLGERLSFEQFARLSGAINEVYTPGASFSFISDGYIFSDVLDIPDTVVEAYLERCKELARTATTPVAWYDMLDFYRPTESKSAIREKIMSQFGVTTEELERRILFEPNVNHLYTGMLYFMEGDLAIRDYPSRNQLHKAAKTVAREMMFRNEAYSALIQKNFADHVRLSMHPSVNDGEKFSVKLIDSPNARHSPWHSAILNHKDGTVSTIHKKDAIEAGYELVNVSGQPYYFQEV